MATKTANVTARVQPEIKEQVDKRDPETRPHATRNKCFDFSSNAQLLSSQVFQIERMGP